MRCWLMCWYLLPSSHNILSSSLRVPAQAVCDFAIPLGNTLTTLVMHYAPTIQPALKHVHVEQFKEQFYNKQSNLYACVLVAQHQIIKHIKCTLIRLNKSGNSTMRHQWIQSIGTREVRKLARDRAKSLQTRWPDSTQWDEREHNRKKLWYIVPVKGQSL